MVISTVICITLILVNNQAQLPEIKISLFYLIALGIILFLTIIVIKNYYKNKINLPQGPQADKIYEVREIVGCLDCHRTRRESCFVIVAQKFVRLQTKELKQVGKKIALYAWFENQFLKENEPIIGKLYKTGNNEDYNTLGSSVVLKPLKEE